MLQVSVVFLHNFILNLIFSFAVFVHRKGLTIGLKPKKFHVSLVCLVVYCSLLIRLVQNCCNQGFMSLCIYFKKTVYICSACDLFRDNLLGFSILLIFVRRIIIWRIYGRILILFFNNCRKIPLDCFTIFKSFF